MWRENAKDKGTPASFLFFHRAAMTTEWIICESTFKEQGPMASSTHWFLFILQLHLSALLSNLQGQGHSHPHQVPPHLASAHATTFCVMALSPFYTHLLHALFPIPSPPTQKSTVLSPITSSVL